MDDGDVFGVFAAVAVAAFGGFVFGMFVWEWSDEEMMERCRKQHNVYQCEIQYVPTPPEKDD